MVQSSPRDVSEPEVHKLVGCKAGKSRNGIFLENLDGTFAHRIMFFSITNL